MKSKLGFACAVSAIVTTIALAGCVTSQAEQHSQHHPDQSPRQAAGSLPSGDKMSMMDMKAMCDMHKKMMGASTPAEQKAMMDEHMKAMPPEMMQKQMAMMQKKCK